MLVHRRVTLSSNYASTHLYTWVVRDTMRVKCLPQEHDAVPRPGLDIRRVQRTNYLATAPSPKQSKRHRKTPQETIHGTLTIVYG